MFCQTAWVSYVFISVLGGCFGAVFMNEIEELAPAPLDEILVPLG